MQFLILGLAVLALGLLLLHAARSANPAAVARQLGHMVGLVAVVVAGMLLLRGAIVWALPIGVLGLWLLAGGGRLPRWPASLGGTPAPPMQTSGIRTEHLEMELEHETGAMRGHVLKGVFAGRDIETLSPADLALLWQDCRFADPRSADILEAWLDRLHPAWREDMARGEAQMGRGPDGRMTVEEAREILGLAAGASEDQIRHAHRELMLKVHPDRGGSTYLAAKVNEAKDVLLGGR